MSARVERPSLPAALTRTSEREIRVERIFNAPRERVWRAFTDPAELAHWWGRGNRLDVERFELEPGGHWRFVEHHEGGSDGFEGRFGEIIPPERLVQTFEWDGMPAHAAVSVMELHDLGGGRTRLVTVTRWLTAEDCDGMIRSGMHQGMNESYAALDRLLAES